MWPLLVLWWGHRMFISPLREDYKVHRTTLGGAIRKARENWGSEPHFIFKWLPSSRWVTPFSSQPLLAALFASNCPSLRGRSASSILEERLKMYGIRFLQFAAFLQELCAYKTSFKEDVHFSKQSWGLAVVDLSLFWISAHYPMLWCFLSLSGSIFEWLRAQNCSSDSLQLRFCSLSQR